MQCKVDCANMHTVGERAAFSCISFDLPYHSASALPHSLLPSGPVVRGWVVAWSPSVHHCWWLLSLICSGQLCHGFNFHTLCCLAVQWLESDAITSKQEKLKKTVPQFRILLIFKVLQVPPDQHGYTESELHLLHLNELNTIYTGQA